MQDRVEPSTSFSLKAFVDLNATQGEKIISVVRLVVATLLFLQMFFFRPLLHLLAAGSLKYWLISGGLLVVIVWSILTLVLLKPTHRGLAFRVLSISFDILCVTVVILPTTLWPTADTYHGFLARPDASGFILLIILASLRLTKEGIAIGGFLVLLCTGFIIFMDFQLNTPLLTYGPREIVVYEIIVLGATVLSFLLTRRILALIQEGAHTMAEYLVQKEYLQQVALVTQAAVEVETGVFAPESLEEVSARTDALGKLARVFQKMAREVYAREQRLVQQVQELRIEVDEFKKTRQVDEITETDYFRELQQKAQKMRSQKKPDSDPNESIA